MPWIVIYPIEDRDPHFRLHVDAEYENAVGKKQKLLANSTEAELTHVCSLLQGAYNKAP